MWDLINEFENMTVVPNTAYVLQIDIYTHSYTSVTRDDMWDLINEFETLKVVPNTIHSSLFTYYISHILTHHTHTGVTRDDMWDLIHEFEIMTVVPNTICITYSNKYTHIHA